LLGWLIDIFWGRFQVRYSDINFDDVTTNNKVREKRMKGKTFEETCKPIWAEARKRGLTEKEIDALIEEAKAKARAL